MQIAIGILFMQSIQTLWESICKLLTAWISAQNEHLNGKTIWNVLFPNRVIGNNSWRTHVYINQCGMHHRQNAHWEHIVWKRFECEWRVCLCINIFCIVVVASAAAAEMSTYTLSLVRCQRFCLLIELDAGKLAVMKSLIGTRLTNWKKYDFFLQTACWWKNVLHKLTLSLTPAQGLHCFNLDTFVICIFMWIVFFHGISYSNTDICPIVSLPNRLCDTCKLASNHSIENILTALLLLANEMVCIVGKTQPMKKK